MSTNFKTASSKSNVAEFQRSMEETRARVSEITRISEDRLNEMFFESGHEFVAMITNNNAQAMHYLPRMREFWGFWKKVWHKIDLDFVMLYERADRWNSFALKPNHYYEYLHRICKDNPELNNTSVQCDYYMLMRMLKRN